MLQFVFNANCIDFPQERVLQWAVSYLSAGVDPERCKAESSFLLWIIIKLATTSSMGAVVVGHLTVPVVLNVCKTTATCSL